jgi:RluA family pseudouridine synthase
MLELLHDDGDVVAVAKPAGVPVIPARDEPATDSVQRQLERQLGRRLWIVHRIDRDASGLVLFACNAEAHRELSLAFEHRRVTKSYVAFAAGALSPTAGRIDLALHGARKGKTRPAQPGEAGALASVTEYETTGTGGIDGAVVSRVAARPLTGRHHQIRVHLRSRECPILFDPLYAKGRTPAALAGAPCARLALHALRIDAPHPSGRGRLALECPLAPDLSALAAWLDDKAGPA